MAKRKALTNHRRNKKVFSRSASKVHRKNSPNSMPMRGGIRL